jgi:ribonuclease R
MLDGLARQGAVNTLTGARNTYHENTRQIIGQRSRKTCRPGQKIRVQVDRIDPAEKKIQFAVVEEEAVRAGRKRRR